MASKVDLRTTARLQSDLFRAYVEMERRIDHTLSIENIGLEEVTGIRLEPEEAT